MILRIYRARFAGADRGRVLAHLRDRVYPANVQTPGLRTFQAGARDISATESELAIVSTWADFSSLIEGIGHDFGRPRWLAEVADHITPIGAAHFELVGEEFRGVVPLAAAAVRVFTGTLTNAGGEAFFEVARRAQEEQLDSGHVVVSHIGRRLTGATEEAAFVTVWRDPESPAVLGGAAAEPGLVWAPYFAAHTFAAYDAVAQVPAKRLSEQALLLADDDRRYVFASKGAGKLLGRPAPRLLGCRIDDLTAPELRAGVPDLWQAFVSQGSQAADFALARPDGSLVNVHYEARAHTPWPGVHAAVLAESSVPVDFDDALSASGIIARYGVAEGMA